MEKSLYTGIQYLKGVGPKKAKLFNQQGIKTIEDLLYHFPRRYEDRSNLLPISLLKENEVQTIQAGVLARRERQSWKRRRFHILEAVVGDDTGKIFCVWFNQPYLKNYFKTGQKLILFGKVQRYSGRLQMNSPEFEIISEEKTDALDAGRIIPIYTVAEGMTQRYFRNILKKALDEHLSKVVEFISFEIRQRNKLLNLAKSLRDIHFPEDLKHPKEAYRRLAFEEFLLFQILVNLRKLKKKQRKGIAHSVDGELAEAFERSLPFELTQAQQRVLQEIKQDMASYLPMSRLLQGDVGSGKTIVAFFAALFAMQSGWQVAFMVPTELLAQQHYLNIKNQISKISAAGVVPEADSPAARSAFSGKNKANPINIQLITSGIKKE
ncbi:MAG: DEAD/DEAH box helicase [Candidatus Omnitrophica bacterium]|nr:DEAD/DEAH box helicase [Candidatus Omnitrophota bacterium]